MFEFLSEYLVATPDFGHSDIWHFNLALKYLLANSLKQGYFPLWAKDIGTGFPLLGEGQIGMFNLYNLLAFKFLDPLLAFNFGYLVIFMTAASGVFFFGRLLRLSRLAAFFFAFIFSLSGVFVTQMNHFNLLQAASLLPWEFYLGEEFLQTNKFRWLTLLAFVISQQVFSGFMQMTMISLFGLFVYLVLRLHQEGQLRRLFVFTIPFFFGFVLSLPQILPSWELIAKSFRVGGVVTAEMARFPFPLKHLLSFFFPYIFGDPRMGTYPPYDRDWGIFWESTGYIGFLSIFLIPAAFLSKQHRRVVVVISCLAAISLVLLLGKYTPFFSVFQIPPFSFFRVPARFLYLFVFALSLLAAIGLETIKFRKLSLFIAGLIFIDVLRFAWGYNAVVSGQNWLRPPDVVNILRTDLSWFRVYAVAPYDEWNKVFLKQGWQNMEDYFRFRNALDPNQNLYWGISSVDYYAGVAPKRLEMGKALISQGVTINKEKGWFAVSSESAKILSLSGVKYLTSPYLLSQNTPNWGISLVATISGRGGGRLFYLYKNENALPHAFLSRNFTVVETVSDLEASLTDPKSFALILEGRVNMEKDEEPLVEAQVLENSDLRVTVAAEAKKPSLLVLTDSFYSGWRAEIDGREVTILPVNLNQRAVVFPPGRHTVVFQYSPYSRFFKLPFL